MMKIRNSMNAFLIRAIGSLLIFMSVACQVSATTVTYTLDGRNAAWVAIVDGNHNMQPYFPSSPYADFNNSYHSSSLGPDGFTASGRGYHETVLVDGLLSGVYAESLFHINFSLASDTTITLNGELAARSSFGSNSAFSTMNLNAITPYNTVGDLIYTAEAVNVGNLNWDVQAINFTSTLGAGEYQFITHAYSSESISDSEFWFTADFTPVSSVPTPATIWLLGSGLIGLVGMARRKTKIVA